MDITSVLQGLTFTLPDLYQQISNSGWEVKSVKFDTSTDRFIAKAKATHGEELEGWGPDQRQAVSNLLLNIVHRNGMRSSKLSMWTHTFTDQLAAIAEGYAKAPLYEPKAAMAFMELGRDAVMRSKALTEHLEITLVNNPDPYTDAQKMAEDVRKRRKLEISRAGVEHPIWSEEQVIAFRIAFDVLGFCAAGSDFSWEGTNRAFAHYAPMVPTEAQKALFSEVIGQTAYATYYRAYGPQKIALFPRFMDGAQQKENPHDGYRGTHPSQIIPPVEMPEAKRIVSKVDYPGQGADINAGWQSPFAQKPLFYYDLEHDRKALGLDELQGLANDMNTGWADQLHGAKDDVVTKWRAYKQEDPQGASRIYQAVSNAIRAACLSPRTMLHHNAQQYQDLTDIPHTETDPNVYWDRLEQARQEWNAARFGDQAREEHRPWFIRPQPDKGTGRRDLAPYEKLVKVLYQRDPMGGETHARELATRMINEKKSIFQERLLEDNTSKKPEDQLMWLTDNEANKMVLRWIQMVTDPSTKHDVYQPSSHEQTTDEWMQKTPGTDVLGPHEAASRTRGLLRDMHDYDESYAGFDNHKIFNTQRYGAFMGTQVQAIAQLTRNIDEIVEAALWDVEHGGSGHHFRNAILRLNVPNVGPKQVSFMWLLLQPLTSQLATIDVHMGRLLGYNEKDLNDRDYYRMERELGARRDAMGLNHIPLGQFQWSTWDLQRTGQRDLSPQDQGMLFDERNPLPLHQDHTPLRVLDPKPAWKARWLPPPPAQRPYKFDFMNMTDPAAEQVSDEWNNTVAQQFKPDQAPVQGIWPRMAKESTSTYQPWFTHPDTGERILGKPGQTLMAHLLTSGYDLPGAWNLGDDAVGKIAGGVV